MKNKYEHSKIANIIDGSGATEVCILINNIPHLKFTKVHYLGLQSWYVSKMDFKIEVYLKGVTIKLEYNSFEKWSAVLKIINEQI